MRGSLGPLALLLLSPCFVSAAEDPADHELFTHLLRQHTQSTGSKASSEDDAVKEFFARQRARCAAGPHKQGTSFTFSLTGQEFSGCLECRLMVEALDRGHHRVAGQESEHASQFEAIGAECQRILDLPCCSGVVGGAGGPGGAGGAGGAGGKKNANANDDAVEPVALLETHNLFIDGLVDFGKSVGKTLFSGDGATSAGKLAGLVGTVGGGLRQGKNGIGNLIAKGVELATGSSFEDVERQVFQTIQGMAKDVHPDNAPQALKDQMKEDSETHAQRLANWPKESKYDDTKSTTWPYYGHGKCDWPEAAGKHQMRGYADLHQHTMSWLGFGSAYVWGQTNGTLAEGTKQCTGDVDHGGFLDTGMTNHKYRKSGYDEDAQKAYIGWPRHDTHSHVMQHEQWMRMAAKRKGKFKLGAINIMAVHNEKICMVYQVAKLTPQRKYDEWAAAGYDRQEFCADVPNIERQIRAVHEMAEKNSEWMGVAFTPEQCRALNEQDKLCVTLSIEVGDLCWRKNDVDVFGAYAGKTETPKECIERWSKLGVSNAFMTHLRNNKYAGASFSSEMVSKAHNALVSLYDTVKGQSGMVGAVMGLMKNFKTIKGKINEPENGKLMETYPLQGVRYTGFNVLGLTPAGEELAREMMRHGWMVELGHLSRKSQRRVYEIGLNEFNGHPMIYTHSSLVERNIDQPDMDINYKADFELLGMLVASGGILGLRDAATEYRKSKVPGTEKFRAIDNDAAGHARLNDFLTREIGLPIAMAADMNGAAGQAGPRFHDPNRDPDGIFRFEAYSKTNCYRDMGALGNKMGMAKNLFKKRGGGADLMNLDFLQRAISSVNMVMDKACQNKLSETLYTQQFMASHPVLGRRTNHNVPASSPLPTAVDRIPDWRTDSEGWCEHMYDTQGVSAICSQGPFLQDMENQGARVDCPVCLAKSAENWVRSWERARAPPSKRRKLRPSFRPYARLPKTCRPQANNPQVFDCDPLTKSGRLAFRTLGHKLPNFNHTDAEGSTPAEAAELDHLFETDHWDHIRIHDQSDRYHDSIGDASMCSAGGGSGGSGGGGGSGGSSDAVATTTTTASPAATTTAAAATTTSPSRTTTGASSGATGGASDEDAEKANTKRVAADLKETNELIAEQAGKTMVIVDKPACALSPFGCCPDGRGRAKGKGQAGCEPVNNPNDADDDDILSCYESHYGCCPDGVTTRLFHEIGNLEGCPVSGAEAGEAQRLEKVTKAEKLFDAVSKQGSQEGGAATAVVGPEEEGGGRRRARQPIPAAWKADLSKIEQTGEVGDAYASVSATGSADGEGAGGQQDRTKKEKKARVECIKEHWRGLHRKEDKAQGEAHWKWASGC